MLGCHYIDVEMNTCGASYQAFELFIICFILCCVQFYAEVILRNYSLNRTLFMFLYFFFAIHVHKIGTAELCFFFIILISVHQRPMVNYLLFKYCFFHETLRIHINKH